MRYSVTVYIYTCVKSALDILYRTAQKAKFRKIETDTRRKIKKRKDCVPLYGYILLLFVTFQTCLANEPLGYVFSICIMKFNSFPLFFDRCCCYDEYT